MKLHVEGRHIKNSLNQIVKLRGVNQAGMLDSPNGWWNPEGGGYTSGLGVWNPDAVKYNLDKMKEWGCNALRLHTNIQWWLQNPSNYRQHIKDMLTWTAEREIYVIFDFYSVQEKTGQDHLPFPPYSLSGSETIVPDVATFVDVWRSVASELGIFSNVVFELWNEPGCEGASTEAKEAWFNAVQQCIVAIRETADNIIIVQWDCGIWCNLDFPPPANLAATMSWVESYPLHDSQGNIVYSFHNYRGGFHRTVPTRVNVWEYDDIKLALQYCLVNYVLNTLNKPVLCGEIGANMWWTGDELERELAYFNNNLTIYNEWNMSYIAWVWTVPAHMQHGLLQNGYAWCPPPTQSGEILIAKIAEDASPPTTPTTPFFGELKEGVYKVTVPLSIVSGSDTYIFKQWEDGSTNPVRTITLNQNVAITATYELYTPPPTTITLTIMAGANGSVFPTDTVTMVIGQAYQFQATPDSGYNFDHWDLGGLSKGSSNPLTITATAEMNGQTLTALFTPVPPTPVTIVIAVTGNGTTDLTPGSHEFHVGDTITIAAIPTAGYAFKQWTLNGTTYTDNPLNLPITADMAGKTLTAEFSSPTPLTSSMLLPALGLLAVVGIGYLATRKKR
ncbi:cellulase family glycosylhydrolase [Candidatus Bathyarchaeota archaeon]|nr:cellulase family glycosylhydrolase [Candidatus Bathyarchaeota archaeon]